MRDKRAIVIKDPRLRKVRNELRNLLLKAVSMEWNNLFDKMDKLDSAPNGTVRTMDDFSEDEVKQYRAYQDQQNRVRILQIGQSVNVLRAGRLIEIWSTTKVMMRGTALNAMTCIASMLKERYAFEGKTSPSPLDTRIRQWTNSPEASYRIIVIALIYLFFFYSFLFVISYCFSLLTFFNYFNKF